MAQSEVESISNGLERCTILLKDILQSDSQEPVSATTSKKKKCQGNKSAVKLVKPWQASSKRNVSHKTKNNMRCKAALNFKKEKVTDGKSEEKKLAKPCQLTKFDRDIPSSTPIVTPIKKEKLMTPRSHQHKEGNSLTSSQSSLIALLQNFNNSLVLPYQGAGDSKCQNLQPSLKGQSEQVTVDVNQSKMDNVATQHLSRTTTNAPEKQPTTVEMHPCIHCEDSRARIVGLENENAVLTKRLKTMEFSFKEKESSKNDISLEIAALQCRTNLFEKKVLELTTALDDSVQLQAEMSKTNASLADENQRIREELLEKDDELKKSGKIFTDETENIKLEVNQAMVKFDQLKLSLAESDTENMGLRNEVQIRDEEIERLNELNKGLQMSNARLLSELNKNHQVSPGRNTQNITTTVLNRLDTILSQPIQTHLVRSNNIPTDINLQKHTNTLTHDVPSPTEYAPPNPCKVLVDTGNKQVEFATTVPAMSTISSSYNTPSVSMISMTTSDEQNFSAGLAILDADIERLQNSLKYANAV
uniref:Uncharacterized LOC100177078 n=1 Tax=Ciona intestinalis TaxID=7719 RepID=F6YCH9_CIOIN|nr:uncharacterized protein LOC100177078 [Ciona intestinalis]|eukprot:XP_002123633.1 uncharacterized protein LOC100177078 [Ciona intestinalis]